MTNHRMSPAGNQLAGALGPKGDVDDLLAQQAAAAIDEILRQALNQTEIIYRHRILGNEHPALEDRRQAWLHLANLIAGQHIEFDTAPALQCQLVTRELEGGLGLVNAEPAGIADHIGYPRRLCQRLEGGDAAQGELA